MMEDSSDVGPDLFFQTMIPLPAILPPFSSIAFLMVLNDPVLPSHLGVSSTVYFMVSDMKTIIVTDEAFDAIVSVYGMM